MKSIGIIRRVDELGRIVIPKELRNNLKIKPGDCLEIFLDDNKIAMKKKDLMENCPDSLNSLLKIISKLLNLNIVITDTDKFLYKEGDKLEDIFNREIGNELYKYILKRATIIRNNFEIFKNETVNMILEPIIVNGDIIGSVIFFKENSIINKSDELAIDIITKLLINYLEV